jgi:serine/threonine protein kinase
VGSGTYKCLEEADGGYLTSQLLSGIAALHGARFIHGDIKPCNIYLTRVRDAYVAQLGDFGLTREVPVCEEGVPHIGGTTGYMAPEMVGLQVGGGEAMVGFAADLFALGIVVYQMMAGMSPFFPVSNVRSPLEFDGACWDPLDEEARSFVSMLLAKSPEARGTAEFALTHPWLSLAAGRPRGVPRPPFAPKPAGAVRFQPVSRTVRRGRTCPSPVGKAISLVRPSVCAIGA